jgi:hypothetical protein
MNLVLDYICIWFIKGANYINKFINIKLAYVTTNSICQGDSVGLLWPKIFNLNIEIFFAHSSFKWQNNAKHNAGVTVAIIGLRYIQNQNKFLYMNETIKEVNNINAYLSNSKNIIVNALDYSISNFPKIAFGSMPRDGGFLIFPKEEYLKFTTDYPNSIKFFKKFIGSEEYIKSTYRYCLWVDNDEIAEAIQINGIKQRFELVKHSRLKSPAKSTQEYANKPNLFVQRSYKKSESLIIPRVSSERREYIPIGFLDENTVIADSAFAVYDAEPWIFGVISSKMHMVWVKTVAGRLETRIRYSSTLCYNTFPFPNISHEQKKIIELYVFDVLDEREKYSEKTLATLYDPDHMPIGLQQAHNNLDLAIDKCYRNTPFTCDEQRLEFLFDLYEKMLTTKIKNNAIEIIS